MPYIKQELNDGPEGLVPLPEIEPPQGFDTEEWTALTEVIITVSNNGIY